MYRNREIYNEERPEGQLSLAPNPAQQKTTVSYTIDNSFKESIKTIEVYTMQGVLINSITVKGVEGTKEMYIDRLPTGTYSVILKAGDRKLHRALLIKK